MAELVVRYYAATVNSVIETLFTSKGARWCRQHTEFIMPFFLTTNREYSALFKTYVYNIAEIEKKERKKIVARLKGPCFGISMALMEFHRLIPENYLDSIKNDVFIRRALFYSLIDTARIDINQLVTFNESETLCTNNYKTTQIFLSKIKNGIYKRKNSLALLRLWSLYSPWKTFQMKSVKWVTPHSIFLYLNSKETYFCFFDNNIKGFVKANSIKQFTFLFLDYIKTMRPEYLSRHVVWRWEEKISA